MALAAGLAGAVPLKSGQVHLNFGIAMMTEPNPDYNYWDSPQEQVYPMPQNHQQQSSYPEIMTAVRSLQQSMLLQSQPSFSSASPQLPPSSGNGQAIALPGQGLTLIVETESARLRITFEPKA